MGNKKKLRESGERVVCVYMKDCFETTLPSLSNLIPL